MQRSVFFRRVLALLLLALLLWTALTAIIYSLLSKPVFTRIKVDELKPKAESVAAIAAPSFMQPDPYFDGVLDSAFEFFDAWIFVVDGLSGDIRNTSLPASSIAAEPEINLQINQNIEPLLTGQYSSLWFTRRLRSSGGEMLFIGVPVSIRFGRQSNVVGAVFFVKPLEELNLGLRNLNIALVGSSLLVLMLMIIPTYLATARLIRPLRQTRDVALAMAEGDFSVRADTRQKGEIGELAYTMNNLAEQLDASISTLTLERNRLRQILEGMAEGLIAVDKNMHITQINPACWALLGQKKQPSIQNIGNPKQHEHSVFELETDLALAFRQALEGAKTNSIILQRSDERKLQVSIARLLDSRGQTAGAVGLIRDVTESERLEQTRRDYVANISHELRTPLTAMRALLEPLHDGMVSRSQDQHRYYNILLRETIRLSHLIDDMLELSRLQANSQPILMKRFLLQDILPDLALKYQSQAEDLDQSLHMPDNLTACPPVYGNEERIEQVLVILLDNAMKFSPAGGLIEIILDWDQERVQVSVKDNGIGIDPADIDHVFDRFYKADKAHQQPGTGLGLSIAREILQHMGQDIEAESLSGQGAIFRFWLKRA